VIITKGIAFRFIPKDNILNLAIVQEKLPIDLHDYIKNYFNFLKKNDKQHNNLILKLILSIAKNIELFNSNCIQHCDLKPSNIMIQYNQRNYLSLS
jgi:serine/threonine protein kinase